MGKPIKAVAGGIASIVGNVFDVAIGLVGELVGALLPPMDMGVDTSNQELRVASNPTRYAVFGETVTSGPIVKYDKIKEGKKEYHLFFTPLADHPCESVELYQLDGKQTTAASGTGYRLIYRLGDQTTAPALALSEMSNVDSSFVGFNITDVYHKYEINSDIFPNGVQDVKFKVRGRRIYDPRKDDTAGGSGTHRSNDENTWEWTDNAALINFHWKRFGGDIELPIESFDMSNIAAEANICDEMVTFTDKNGQTQTEKRYTCNGVVNLKTAQRSVETQLLSSCLGRWVRVGTHYYLAVGAYRGPSTLTIGEADLKSAPKRQPSSPLEDRCNAVTGNIINPKLYYQESPYSPVVSTFYQTNRDGGRYLEHPVDFSFTQSETMAQRLARSYLEFQAAGDSITVSLGWKGLLTNPLRVINLDLPTYGITGKEYEVIRREYQHNTKTWTIELKETAPEIWDDTIVPAEKDLTPNTPIDNTIVSAPTGLSFTPTPNDSYRQGVLTWDHEISQAIRRYTVLLTKVPDDGWYKAYYPVQASQDINNLPAGNYQAVISAENRFGKSSPGTPLTFNVNLPSTPATELTVSVLPGRVVITGPALPNESATYEWRVGFVDDFAQAIPYGRNITITVTPTPQDGTLYGWYRLVDGDLTDASWVAFTIENLIGLSSSEVTPELIADLVLPESIFSIKDTFASIASDLQQASNQYSQTSGDYILLAQSVTDLNGDLGLVKLDVQNLQNAKATFDAEITLTNFLNAGFGYDDEFGNYVEGAAFVRALEEYRIENNTGQFVSLYNYFNALETRTGDLEGIYQFGIETYGGFTGIEIKNGTAAESSIRIFTDNWVFASQDGRVGYQYSSALGRHIWYGATVHIGTNEMSVEDFDQPFGPNNLTYWRGPVLLNLGEPDLSQLTKANATEWRDETGAKYTAGDFTAKGVLESSALKAGSGVILNDEGLTGPPIIYTFASGRSNDRVDRTLTMPILYGPGYVVTPNVAHSNYRLSYYNMDMFLKVIYTKSAGTSTVSNYEVEVKYTFQPSDPTGPTYPSGHNQWVTVVTGSVNPLHDYASVPLIYRYTTRSEPWDTLQIRILVTSASGEGKPLSVLGELTVFNQSRSSNTPGTISSDSYESPSNNEPDYDDIYVPPGYIAP